MTHILAFILGGSVGMFGFAVLMIGRNADQDKKIAEPKKEVHFQKLINKQLSSIIDEVTLDIKA